MELNLTPHGHLVAGTDLPESLQPAFERGSGHGHFSESRVKRAILRRSGICKGYFSTNHPGSVGLAQVNWAHPFRPRQGRWRRTRGPRQTPLRHHEDNTILILYDRCCSFTLVSTETRPVGIVVGHTQIESPCWRRSRRANRQTTRRLLLFARSLDILAV